MDVLPRKTTKLWFFALAAIGFILIVGFGRCAAAGHHKAVHHKSVPSYNLRTQPVVVSLDIVEAVRETAASVAIEIVTVTCDDDCLRLWESFDILESMERLRPYRVRAAAWDEAYTAWLSQR
jgi:hypothetical protein